MHHLLALIAGFAMACLGVLIAMPAMSNGGLLAGYEFFGMLGVGAATALVFVMLARKAVQSKVLLSLQAVVLGVSAPWLVLFAPLFFCIVFRPNASCV